MAIDGRYKVRADSDAANTIDSSVPPGVRDLADDKLGHAIDISSQFDSIGAGLTPDTYHNHDDMCAAPRSLNLTPGVSIANDLRLQSSDAAHGGVTTDDDD